MKNNINLKFHKINIRIESSISEFVEFITQYFHDQVNHEDNDESDILIKFEKVNNEEYGNLISDSKKDVNFSQLSRSIYGSMSSVILSDIQHLPGFILSFRVQNNKLEVFGYYYNQESIKKYLGKLFFNENDNLRLFLLLKYYLILFPVIWYYEHFYNKYLLHASALLYKRETILFSGLGGVGKSTFVISLLENSEFQFISDNLVVYGDNELIAVNEAIALDENSLFLCKNSLRHLNPLNLHMSHGRKYFRVRDPITSAGNVEKIFFIKFSDATIINKLDISQAKEKIDLINSIAKEIVEYRSMASALNLALGYEFSLVRNSSVESLIENTDCYELNIRPGDDLKTAHLMLSKILK